MRIIDADGHVLERDIPWADLIDAPYRSRAPRPVQDNRGYTFIMIDGKLTPKPVGKGCSFVGAPRSHSPQPTTGMVDPEQRLKDMDLEGIDTAVLFGTSPFLSLPFVEDKDLASAVARVYNNWLAGYCSADPRRLKGVAAVAIQDPTEAIKELRRAVDELKFVAVAAPPISASKKISTILISFLFLQRQSSSTCPCAFTWRRRRCAGGHRAFRSSIFSLTPWRIHSSR